MITPRPNLLKTTARSPYSTLDSRKLHEAADRALDHYLKRENTKPCFADERTTEERSMKMFTVVANANPEALAIQTYETFSSVSILLLDLAESLDDKQRHLAMAIYQMSELGLMLVERSLDIERAISPA
ncbi:MULTISPECIES: DUF6124 family protein [Pseudomonas]|uniref:DUF3077 domain-containing protein n=2 Tax=Gammaproteobacteria TaxID=1236 RepID=A0A423IXM1_9PSED|nr:DUF6124 family protein [Pseudomonas lini]MBK5310355.1 hypothetical protein [Pseudomonas sp. TH71]MBK5369559.1 hypothetical protein [Pseudomonas sp. TH40]MBK5380728.1 hypothetical protein [Pseudomonas sp. TH35]MBK5386187.1 hypothetical protein [Pseudomonas sp. TH38]MBK5403482.1 hypothetical protein [Pseudomonas sp. TH37]MBK5465580.1 hypothetical protein [Pseudomonas sp. TH20]MBK5521859.1 hypothetical protein [Pseudomonas sp. TH09]